jgi:ribosomal-protein-alanine N-acetyltransferase
MHTTAVDRPAESRYRVRFEQMSDPDARAVAAWRYEPPYDFYDADADQNDLLELLDAQRRGDVYFAARDETGTLIGFF